jgi:hypothetical protein
MNIYMVKDIYYLLFIFYLNKKSRNFTANMKRVNFESPYI